MSDLQQDFGLSSARHGNYAALAGAPQLRPITLLAWRGGTDRGRPPQRSRQSASAAAAVAHDA